ncbi:MULTISPECIES: ATP-binding cassette domain-containing protein [Actinomadura]|uniref:ATP-binding cassette domain-containing protein n=1 Tax=Actinomadura TaxID=1988 RepID=UPI0003AD65E9|nr:Doxorubicin resistance ATP-binding protein DrrA [Actinomadura madurae]
MHTSRLRRTYERGRRDPVVALGDLTLTVGQNETHGLLGPNGAGKTTLIKILSTVLLPSGGSARILGHDVVADTGSGSPRSTTPGASSPRTAGPGGSPR